MATDSRQAPSGDRRILIVALSLLGGVTGACFGRVFLGTQPAVRLAAAGVLAALIAALLARRSLAVSLAASAAGLLLTLGLLVFPEATWLGLPGPRTVEAIVRSLEVVTERAATEVAPAPPLAPLMTAAIMAVWSASTAAHALAVRSGSSVLPLLPGAALLGFSGVVTEEPPRPGYVLIYLAAAFAVLFAEAVQRTSSWGGPRTGTVFSGRWARIIGGTAALAAVAIPGVLPGFGRGAILEIDKPGERIRVSPIVDIRPSLLQNPAADLFWVRAPRPAYWRMVVLDTFDGRLWKASETEAAGKQSLGVGLDSLTPSSAPRRRLLEQEVEIARLAAPWLPAAADPVSIGLEDDLGASHDTRTGVLGLEADTADGMRYEVTSAQPWPNLRALEGVIPNNPLGDPRYTALPTGMPDRIREIALNVAGRADTAFDAVLAIQNYLRSFRYDESVPAGHGSDDVLQFLERSRRGYCEQFAGTMAVLVRTLGYPARVSIGFLPGDPDETGRFRVTTAQAHAWPEVHFGEYGWLPFEPTPSRNNPSATYLLPPSLRGRGTGGSAGGDDGGTGRLSAVEQRESFQPLRAPIEPLPDPASGVGRERFPWWRLLLAALGIGAALVLVGAPARAIGRWLALSGAREPRRRVLAAYAWLQDGASDLGLGRRQGETPQEYGERLRAIPGIPSDALDRIGLLAGRALYSPRGPERDQAEEAVDAARAVLRELRRRAGWLRSLTGALRPGTSPA